MLHTANVKLVSMSPYSQSRMHDTPKLNKERPDAWEQRTWREKCTTDEKGQIVIPQMAFKMALDAVAKKLGMQIPGRGKSTYTKHFVGGVLCLEAMAIGYTKDKVAGETINANADGVRGSGKRVKRIFPLIPTWKGELQFQIFDETITEEVFLQHLEEAGKFVGIGRFRPENGGYYGRFKVDKFKWS